LLKKLPIAGSVRRAVPASHIHSEASVEFYEYSRARAGHYAKVLFNEPEFVAAVEQSRWRAYPIGLAMVAEVVEGVLRPPRGEDDRRQFEALCAIVLSVFDRYPTPKALGGPTWSAKRFELERRLQSISLHPPKRVIDISAPFEEAYFNLLPIHEKLRQRDYPTTCNYLKVTLCNIHDELIQRLNKQPLAEILSTYQA
jgi:hypothetical protein